MKLILQDYGFTYDVTKDGIKAIGQIFDSEIDKQLYLAILENLQTDFRNAPLNIANGDYINQKLLYVINLNRYLNIKTDENITIKQNIEAFDINQLRKMSVSNPIYGVFADTTDLQ